MDAQNREALAARAESLAAAGLNGLKRVLVTLRPAVEPLWAELAVELHNELYLDEIVTAGSDPGVAAVLFAIRGGERLPAGSEEGQVQVIAVASGAVLPGGEVAVGHWLTLTVAPIGDYSTYRLGLCFPMPPADSVIDPVFSELPFKFRPHCFSIACSPPERGTTGPAPVAIDYLARDYDSFRHLLMGAMAQRVPGWRPTSEADLDQTLIDLFSAAADELADYQDRIMNEAYLATARKRVSLARHARLMDDHIHQGSQAGTWVALALDDSRQGTLAAGEVTVRTGAEEPDPADQVFVSRAPVRVHDWLNALSIHDWGGIRAVLQSGATSVDLRVEGGLRSVAETLRDLIRDGQVRHLLIQEHLNPATGLPAGRDPAKRQLLELRSGDGAEVVYDPVELIWMLRVHWLERDALRRDYCILAKCSGEPDPVRDITLLHGNLVEVYHGRLMDEAFAAPGSAALGAGLRAWEATARWGTVCRLAAAPLAYRQTAPGGEVAPRTTLQDPDAPDQGPCVRVELADGRLERWTEQPDLIHSGPADRHYRVETDEAGLSLLRFGNGDNGRALPPAAIVRCRFQVGEPLAGNLGADRLVRLVDAIGTPLAGGRVWNPFAVTDGRAPEPSDGIRRRVPEAYCRRQLRAVTLADYRRRAEEVAGVSRAAATYAWTGSWRTLRVTIDPAGTTVLTPVLRAQVAEHLEVVRLLGEDLEIRAPRFVPLAIWVVLCVRSGYDFYDVHDALGQVFTAGWRRDGQPGFFHPDRWTFGQGLYASQVLGAVQAVAGVEHVVSIRLSRFGATGPGTDAVADLAPDEVLLVRNDPDHREQGFIHFEPPEEAV